MTTGLSAFQQRQTTSHKAPMLVALAASLLMTVSLQATPPVEPGQRILFLGDSITYGAGYVAAIDAALLSQWPEVRYEVISAGLPSESVSGLSEPGHADGKFERPTLHERLGRVLEKTKPNLVVACYGMNDGIFMPWSEDRFKAFQEGMIRFHQVVEASGAEIVHLTPPVFDPAPIPAKLDDIGAPGKMFRGYDQVLNGYSTWLLEQRARGWMVIDLHGPMQQALDRQRSADPGFTFAKDGVHPNDAGHAVMAKAVLSAWGIEAWPQDRVLNLVKQKTALLRDAWLSATGHLRPGIKPGLPLDEARKKAGEHDQQARSSCRPKT